MSEKPEFEQFVSFELENPDEVIRNPHSAVTLLADETPVTCTNAGDALVYLLEQYEDLWINHAFQEWRYEGLHDYYQKNLAAYEKKLKDAGLL